VLFTIGDEQRVAQAGDVLHFPPATWHGATMLDEEVILVDIFSPDKRRLLELKSYVLVAKFFYSLTNLAKTLIDSN